MTSRGGPLSPDRKCRDAQQPRRTIYRHQSPNNFWGGGAEVITSWALQPPKSLHDEYGSSAYVLIIMCSEKSKEVIVLFSLRKRGEEGGSRPFFTPTVGAPVSKGSVFKPELLLACS